MAKYSLDGKYDDIDELYEQSELDAGGKIAEVRGIPVRKYRLVNGLVSFVIGDPGIGDVDGYPLRRYAEPAACLADAYANLKVIY